MELYAKQLRWKMVVIHCFTEVALCDPLFPIMAAATSSTFSPGSHSPSDTIHEFYDCINHKNLKQLGHYISRDCYIEECSFSTPLQGKKVIIIIINTLYPSQQQ